MGRVIMLLGSLVCAGIAQAEGVPQGIPQQQMDAIREYHTKQIMGSSQTSPICNPMLFCSENCSSVGRTISTSRNWCRWTLCP